MRTEIRIKERKYTNLWFSVNICYLSAQKCIVLSNGNVRGNEMRA